MPDRKTSQTKTETAAVVTACPVEQTIQVIGGKWKLLLLRSLLLNGPQGYNELLASVTDISAKELTRNLKELRAVGLVMQSDKGSARITPYLLTKESKRLMPIFKSMLVWGTKVLPATNIPVR